MILGTGKHTYEWEATWPKLPAGKRFGYTHGVVTDQADNVYVFNQSEDAVSVFDRSGKFVRSFNPKINGVGFETGAHGLRYSFEGGREFLYLTDYELPRLCKMTLDGEIVWQLDGPPAEVAEAYEKPSEYRPTNMAVLPDGSFYVTDGYGKGFIYAYDAAAKFKFAFGGNNPLEMDLEFGVAGFDTDEQPTSARRLDCPHGIEIDHRGPEPLLLVADRENVRIVPFRLDGTPLSPWGTSDLRYPCDFCFHDGDVCVPDLYGRLTIFDQHNQFVTHLGDQPGIEEMPGWPNVPAGQLVPGKFNSPHAAWWDKHGDLYVVEWVETGRVTKLVRKLK